MRKYNIVTRVNGVEVVHWNPRRKLFDRGPRIAGRVNNFGDLVGPILARRLTAGRTRSSKRLLTVGSILHFAQDGDVVWGTGRNGSLELSASVKNLDVRAVRGPLTQSYLRSKGIEAPPIYGDPGLLLPLVFPETSDWSTQRKFPILEVPNLGDYSARARVAARDHELRSPVSPFWECVRAIASSDYVVGSSLHGVIVAEAFGVSARAISSSVEADFKYRDYLAGTGRPDERIASTFEEALELGPMPAPVIDLQKLLAAFPYDLWSEIE